MLTPIRNTMNVRGRWNGPLLCRMVAILGAVTALPLAALGHASGENYIFIDVHENHIEGRFEILVKDLGDQLGHAIDSDRLQDSIDQTSPAVRDYILEHFKIINAGEALMLNFSTNAFLSLPQGVFAQYYFQSDATPISNVLRVENHMLFEKNRFHRGLLLVNYNDKTKRHYGEERTALLFSSSNRTQELDLMNVPGLLRARDFVWQGMLHIWIGMDHVLFLVALVLPAVLKREGGRWVPIPHFRQALWKVVKIVTAFTVAHSITLSLAALDVVSLSSRLVESIIALSIVIVALNNIRPVTAKTWSLILGFGLFHGLGFASVMGDLPFRMGDLMKVIIAFNIGVELGQIAIVAALFPVLFAIRGWRGYNRLVLCGGSILVTAVALYWFVERAFDL